MQHPVDALKANKEETNESLKEFRLPDQDLLIDAKARIGRPMSHAELTRIIVQLANGRIWSENSINYPGGMNFYYYNGDTKICCNTPFEKGFLPEYTIIHEDERRLPGARTVGWREVLWRLIQQRILTKKQVDAAFGRPSPTPSTRWQEYTQQY